MAKSPPLDLAEFRLHFPQFSDVDMFPDAVVEWVWSQSGGYLSKGPFLRGAAFCQAWELMTAHLLTLWDQQRAAAAGGGSVGGVVTGATVDKVAVSLAAPPTRTGLQFWLAQTGPGMALWALLRANFGPGLYVGGLPERAAIRKVGGIF